MKTRLLQAYFDSRRTPVSALDHAQRLHESLREQNARLYARILRDARAHLSHRAVVLAHLVRDSGTNCDEILSQLSGTSADELLQLLDVLRLHRMNGRRIQQTGLRLLLGRDDLAEIVAFHRQRVKRLLKHLLGERTWASVVRALAPQGEESSAKSTRFLQQHILRFAANESVALQSLKFVAGFGFPSATDKDSKSMSKSWLVIPWLQKSAAKSTIAFAPTLDVLVQSLAVRFDLDAGKNMPHEVLTGIRGGYFPDVRAKRVAELAADKATTTKQTPVTTQLKRWLSGEAVELPEPVQAETKVDANVGIVLDMSQSMTSSGERLNHPAALAQAIVRQFESSVANVQLVRVGGASQQGFATPEGDTDLATAVLQLAAMQTDAIFVVTDGFENTRQGDVTAVVEGLVALGIQTPVHQVVPLFTTSEDVSDRKLGDNMPLILIDDENATGELIARAQLAASPEELDEAQAELICQLAMG